MIDIVKMAQRLKSLRRRDNYSHEELSQALKEKYGISISDKQLMYYESGAKDIYHIKANTVLGMAAKTLSALANLYNVSVDYIIGETDVATTDIDIQDICKYIGLSETAVGCLHAHSSLTSEQLNAEVLLEIKNGAFAENGFLDVDPYLLPGINMVLEHGATYAQFFKYLINYLYSDGLQFSTVSKVEEILDADNKENNYKDTVRVDNNLFSNTQIPWYFNKKDKESLALMMLVQSLQTIKRDME